MLIFFLFSDDIYLFNLATCFRDGNSTVDLMLTFCKFVSFNLMSHDEINSSSFLGYEYYFFFNDDNDDGVESIISFERTVLLGTLSTMGFQGLCTSLILFIVFFS